MSTPREESSFRGLVKFFGIIYFDFRPDFFTVIAPWSRKVFTFLIEADKKFPFLKEYMRQDFAKLEKIAERITKETKKKEKLPNYFEMLHLRDYFEINEELHSIEQHRALHKERV